LTPTPADTGLVTTLGHCLYPQPQHLPAPGQATGQVGCAKIWLRTGAEASGFVLFIHPHASVNINCNIRND